MKVNERLRRGRPVGEAKTGVKRYAVATTATDEAAQVLRLESSTIRDSGDLQRALVARFDAPGAVRLDAAAMERVDTTTLQLLAAFIQEVRAASRSVEWVACSDALVSAARAVGLLAALGLTADGN